jgi:hypothetical protein
MDKKTKNQVIELIKSVRLYEENIPEDPVLLQRKYYKFGAYDAMRTLSEMVMSLPEPKKVKQK